MNSHATGQDAGPPPVGAPHRGALRTGLRRDGSRLPGLRTAPARRGRIRFPRPARESTGFSLVEVLAAMSVLAIILVLVGRLFSDSTKAMRIGTRNASVNANARAVMDFIARDVGSAMFDDPSRSSGPPYLLLRAKVPSSPPADYLGLRNDVTRELYFVSLGNAPSSSHKRSTTLVGYWLRKMKIGTGSSSYSINNRYELMRGETYDDTSSAFRRYTLANWVTGAGYSAIKSSGAVVIQNVRSFRVAYLGSDSGYDLKNNSPRTDSESNARLAFLDVELEVLDEDDAIRIADLWVGGATRDKVAYVERVVKRYFQRIYFHNANGYYRPDR